MIKALDGSVLMCEVCEQEPAVGVASVPGIPYSAAYGARCLARGADPYFIIRTNVSAAGGPSSVHPMYLQTMTFVDDEYMTLAQALVKYPMTIEEIDTMEGFDEIDPATMD